MWGDIVLSLYQVLPVFAEASKKSSCGTFWHNQTFRKSIADDRNNRERRYLRCKFITRFRKGRSLNTISENCLSRRVILRHLVVRKRVGILFRKMFEKRGSRWSDGDTCLGGFSYVQMDVGEWGMQGGSPTTPATLIWLSKLCVTTPQYSRTSTYGF